MTLLATSKPAPDPSSWDYASRAEVSDPGPAVVSACLYFSLNAAAGIDDPSWVPTVTV